MSAEMVREEEGYSRKLGPWMATFTRRQASDIEQERPGNGPEAHRETRKNRVQRYSWGAQ